MAAYTDPLSAARAEALFTSMLPRDAQPTLAEASLAIRQAVRTHGGTRGCAAYVAYEYGEHPESALPRMRWARTVIAALYARPDHRSFPLAVPAPQRVLRAHAA